MIRVAHWVTVPRGGRPRHAMPVAVAAWRCRWAVKRQRTNTHARMRIRVQAACMRRAWIPIHLSSSYVHVHGAHLRMLAPSKCLPYHARLGPDGHIRAMHVCHPAENGMLHEGLMGSSVHMAQAHAASAVPGPFVRFALPHRHASHATYYIKRRDTAGVSECLVGAKKGGGLRC